MATKDTNGMERWRGSVTAQLESISHRLDELRATIDSVTERFGAMVERHADEDKKQFEGMANRLVAVEHAAAKSNTKLAVVVAVLAAIFTGVVDAVARSYFN